MPTYDYECTKCGHKFEKFQSMSSAPIKKCPECGKNTAKRLIGTGAGLIFKGSGFYITDYRSEGYKESAKADSAPAETKAADSKPAETKTADTKPAAAEAKPAAKSEAPAPKAESKPAPKQEAKSSSAKKRS